jgi:hypothetical protein
MRLGLLDCGKTRSPATNHFWQMSEADSRVSTMLIDQQSSTHTLIHHYSGTLVVAPFLPQPRLSQDLFSRVEPAVKYAAWHDEFGSQ